MNYWMIGPILATIFLLWFYLSDMFDAWPKWLRRLVKWQPFKRNKR